MYESFFGLRAKPFTLLPDPRFLVETETHREALAALIYGIRERKGFIVVTGEVGTGKTLMVRTFLERVGPDVVTAYVPNPRLDVLGLFAYVFAEFGIPERPATKGDCLVVFNQWLIRQLAQGRTPVLVVDEGQAVSREMLEEIRLLTNLETASEKLLHVVLVGQPELEVTLAEPGLRQLVQRIAVRHRIEPLSHHDTRRYIGDRLERAGGQGDGVFTSRALRWVDYYGCGIPRLINALCDTSLMIAYGARVRPVTHRNVREAARLVAATAA